MVDQRDQHEHGQGVDRFPNLHTENVFDVCETTESDPVTPFRDAEDATKAA